jgi:hypothetical protein
MRSAVEMYVRICYERNILGKLLHKRGFEAVSTTQSATESGGAPDQTMEHITIVEDMVTQQGTQRIAYDDMFKIGVPMHLIAGQHAAKASSCLQS